VTETLLSLVPRYGAFLVMATTYLSCLALPIPASVIMLAAGAFAAAGDLSLPLVALAALAGAVAGDQTGYSLGRFGGGPLWDRVVDRRGAAGLVARVARDLEARAWSTVFLTRWLFSALGPYVNLAAGATRLDWARFSVAALAGEAVWVTLYVGLGHAFASRIDEVGAAMGNIALALGSAAVAMILGRLLWRAARSEAGTES
jgi:membrane protein DedA with SNARE-associated domain